VIALEEAHGIVDLVGDAGGELAYRGEFLVLDHENLGLLEPLVRLRQLEVGLPEFALVLYPLANVLDDALQLHDLAFRPLEGMGGLEAEDGAPVLLRQHDLVVLDEAFFADSAQEEFPIGGIEGESGEGMPQDLVLLRPARQGEARRID